MLTLVTVLLWAAYVAAQCSHPKIDCFDSDTCEDECPGGGQPHDACVACCDAACVKPGKGNAEALCNNILADCKKKHAHAA